MRGRPLVALSGAKRALEELRVRSFMRYFIEDYGQLVLEAPRLLPGSAR